jgi:hypothetical protein
LNRHVVIVAAGFRFLGWVSGALSAISLIGATAAAIILQLRPAPDPSRPLDLRTYGLVGLLNNGARAINHGLNALLGAAEVVCLVMAAISLAVLLLAVLLHVIGRRLARGAPWARVGGGLAALGSAAISALFLSATTGEELAAPALALGVSLYALWTMVFRFA